MFIEEQKLERVQVFDEKEDATFDYFKPESQTDK